MNSYACLCACLLFAALAAAQNIEAGLVAYYPFNSPTADESAFGNHIFGQSAGVSFESDPANGNRFAVFNGINGYLLAHHADHIDFDNHQPYTVSFLINAPVSQWDTAGTVNDIMSKWDNRGSTPYPYAIRINNQRTEKNGTITVTIYEGDSFGCGGVVTMTSKTAINDGKWHHVMFTRDEQRRLRLYIDCQMEVEADDPTSCNTRNLSDLIIGHRETTGQFPRALLGKLDEIRIYNRALTLEELDVLCAVASKAESIDLPTQISLFPNPLKRGQTLSINLDGPAAIERITLFTAQAQRMGVYRQNQPLDVPAGVYLLEIQLDSGRFITERLIVVD